MGMVLVLIGVTYDAWYTYVFHSSNSSISSSSSISLINNNMASSIILTTPTNSNTTPAVVGSSYRMAYDAKDPLAVLPGVVLNNASNPTITFSPIKIRSVILKNRLVVSPMCQYSSEDGFMNDHHFRQLTTWGMGGAGLVIFEATAVTPNGRISPQCTGLWKDEQIAPMKRIVDFLHVHGVMAALQIAHAGRKASCYSPFQGNDGAISEREGGWPNNVVGPSTVKFAESYAQPRALTVDEIKEYQLAYVAAVKRADAAGFDVLELHGAHGYLISNFLSPLANKRSDDYGGSFENRIRFLLETVTLVRATWPPHKPLSVRINGTDYVAEGGWTMDETVELAKRLQPLGVDIIDISAGGNIAWIGSPLSTLKQPIDIGYQVPFTDRVKREVPGLITMAVGNIHTGTQAEGFLKAGSADLIAVGRAFLRNPYLAQFWAQELNVELTYPPQAQTWIPFHAKKDDGIVIASRFGK